jgi:hypothetical protein
LDETPRSTLLRGVPDRPFDGRAACGLLRVTQTFDRLPLLPHRSPACGAPCPQRARAFDSSLDLRERGALEVSRAYCFPPRARKDSPSSPASVSSVSKLPRTFIPRRAAREHSFTVLFPHRYSPTHVPPRPRDLRTSSNGFIGTKSCVGGLRDGRGVRLRWRSRRRRISWRQLRAHGSRFCCCFTRLPETRRPASLPCIPNSPPLPPRSSPAYSPTLAPAS